MDRIVSMVTFKTIRNLFTKIPHECKLVELSKCTQMASKAQRDLNKRKREEKISSTIHEDGKVPKEKKRSLLRTLWVEIPRSQEDG